jgi:putative N6-adenine-specific DNA methylase
VKIVAKTLFGLENLLASELKALGAKKVEVLNRAVSFEGNQKVLYSVNIHSRLAARFIVPFANFLARNEDDLYKKTQKIDWSKYLSNDKTFAIGSTTHGELFTHSQFAAQKVKDAIVDQFRDKTGERPSVDIKNPDVLINLHITDHQVNIASDSSGDSLNKRGYRTESNDAPISEILAAAMVILSAWDGTTPLLDAMTGSGTIAIEAALINQNIAPGINRKFGFQNWDDYDSALFEKLIDEAKQNIKPSSCIIHARDINMGSLAIARRNAERANVMDYIIFDCVDFMKSEPIAESGIILMNPPYGERLEERLDMDKFYHEIGFRLKHNYSNHAVWVISSNLPAMKRLGLKPDERIKLFNGQLECRFNKYSLFKGKRIDQLIQHET